MFRRLFTPSLVRPLAHTIRPQIPRIRAPAFSRTFVLNTHGQDVADMVDKLTINQYTKISNEYLEGLADELEMLSEDHPKIDSELTQGVLTVSVPPNGTYVINKQPANKQIWLSSPVSGPNRYDLVGGKWITLRDGLLLTDLLEMEVSLALEQEVKFTDLEG